MLSQKQLEIIEKAKRSRPEGAQGKNLESSREIAAFSFLGPRTEEAKALDLLAVNAMLGGLPATIGQALGLGGKEKIKEARELTGGYGVASEALGLLPISLATGGGGLGRQMVTGGTLGGILGGTLADPGQAVGGSALGTGIGIVAPPVIQAPFAALSKAGKIAARPFVPKAQQAEERIISELAKLDMEPKSLQQFIEQPSPVTLAEQAGGEFSTGLEPLVRAATSETGAAAKFAQEKLGKRAATAAERVLQSADVLPSGDVKSIAASLSQKRAEKASTLYTEAFDDFIPDEEIVSSVSKLFYGDKASPTLKSALDKAVKNLKDDVELDVEIPKDAKLEDMAPKVFNRALDQVKQVIDDKISVAIRKAKWSEVRRLTNLRNSFLNQLDDVNPSYANARSQFAGDLAVENALELGRNIFGKKMDASTVRDFISGASESEIEHFRIGVSDFIRSQLDEGKISNIKYLLNKDFMKRLESAWPSKKSFDNFADTVRQEIRMYERGGQMIPNMPRISGSDGSILGAVEQAFLETAPAGRLASGSTRSGIVVGLTSSLRKLLNQTGKMSPEESEDITRMLLSNTPEERRATIDRLINSGKLNDDFLSGFAGFMRNAIDTVNKGISRSRIATTTPTLEE